MDATDKRYDDNYTIGMLDAKILTSDKQYDLSKIITAYNFAEKAHKGQFRSSGQPYIIHPLAVAFILLDLGMDTDTICAAMLHDVVEDTDTTLNDLKKRFGQDVAMMVDGVTKLTKFATKNVNKESENAENVRRMLLAMARDIRVMIIKLCDRLHNMRTLCYRPSFKQINKAIETMNIYVPIADRIGMRSVKEELEELSFKYIDPYAFAEIEKMLESSKDEREACIKKIESQIEEKLKKETFEQPPIISGRVKSMFGIYKKLYMGNKESINEVYDKYAVRVIVSTESECYTVLGLVHELYTPIPGENRIKDYIAVPKQNGYQSLHTTVISKEGVTFEIQIRTREMHEVAEYGVAAHWKYKCGISGKDKMDNGVLWARQLVENQKESDDVEEILRAIKTDIAPEEIYVITPKGKTIALPENSTVIDFAYKIHTEVGHKTTGAKVDGKNVAFDYKLQTGQICEILTSKDPNKGPNRAWLKIVKTTEAKSKIRSWFKRECRDENISQGKMELKDELKRYRIIVSDEELSRLLEDDFKRHNCNCLDDFYASIGYGGIMLSKMMPRIKDKYVKMHENDKIEKQPEINVVTAENSAKNSAIILDNIDDCVVKYAQCCNPLPGDDIVGFITRGHGISVHTKKCSNYKAVLERNNPDELARWCEIQWSAKGNTSIQTSIEVIAIDRVGLVFDITAILTEAHIPIVHSSSRNLKNGNALFEATIKIASAEQLKNLFDKLKKVKDVISVGRASI